MSWSLFVIVPILLIIVGPGCLAAPGRVNEALLMYRAHTPTQKGCLPMTTPNQLPLQRLL